MADRFKSVRFVPPGIDAPTLTPSYLDSSADPTRRASNCWPLFFWHDPPWQRLSTALADDLATAVAALGIAVTARLVDLTSSSRPSRLFQPPKDFLTDPLPRIVPYTAERFGVVAEDFDAAAYIDVRLWRHKDSSGRFAYVREELNRVAVIPSDDTVATLERVPSAALPPDVIAIGHLASKLDQLRKLSPTARIIVSFDPAHLASELPRIVGQLPDAVLLRFDDPAWRDQEILDGIRVARERLDAHSESPIGLWIHAGEVGPDAAAKLLGLGVDSIAVDSWCDEVLNSVATSGTTAAMAKLGFGGSIANATPVQRSVNNSLPRLLDRARGLAETYRSVEAGRRFMIGPYNPGEAHVSRE